MGGRTVHEVEAALRQAAALLHTRRSDRVATDVHRAEEWLDLGAADLAFVNLTAIAEEAAPDREVWVTLQRAARALATGPLDAVTAAAVRAVDEEVERSRPLDTRPPPPLEESVVLRGGALGTFMVYATWPLSTMEVRVDRVELRVSFLDRDVLRRGAGRILLLERPLGTSVRLEHDGHGRGPVTFLIADRRRPRAELERFGWADSIVAVPSPRRRLRLRVRR